MARRAGALGLVVFRLCLRCVADILAFNLSFAPSRNGVGDLRLVRKDDTDRGLRVARRGMLSRIAAVLVASGDTARALTTVDDDSLIEVDNQMRSPSLGKDVEEQSS